MFSKMYMCVVMVLCSGSNSILWEQSFVNLCTKLFVVPCKKFICKCKLSSHLSTKLFTASNKHSSHHDNHRKLLGSRFYCAKFTQTYTSMYLFTVHFIRDRNKNPL